MDETPPTPPPDGGGSSVSTRVRVGREVGDCAFCAARNVDVVIAYDERIFPGKACPDCVLLGKASTFAVGSKEMRPVVFVAKALKGIQPFAKLLAAAEVQRNTPVATKEALVRARAAREARGGAGIPLDKMLGNHDQRRRQRSIMRKEMRKAQAAARKKNRPN